MQKSLKIGIVAAVALLALTAVAIVYANSQNSSTINAAEPNRGMWNTWTFGSDNLTIPDNVTFHCDGGYQPRMRGDNLYLNEGMLQNATLATVQGTVVTEVRGMLVLNTGSGEVRIMLPKEWTVGNELVDRTTLFNGTFASAGQTVTVEVLESTLLSNTSFSINTMLGYEAINATSTHAYAVLPFNIQPSS